MSFLRSSASSLKSKSSAPATPASVTPPNEPTGTSIAGSAHSTETIEVDEDAADAGEVGKFRQLLSVLRKTLHAPDLSNLRISMPANLLEPIGNLEYWMYCERPDFFAAMGESDDELERMLAVLRWTFTKDLKFVKHKIAKPYNSILFVPSLSMTATASLADANLGDESGHLPLLFNSGEHFHCHFDCEPIYLDPTHGGPEPTQWLDHSPSPEVLAAAGRASGTPSSSKNITPPAAAYPSSTPGGDSSAASSSAASYKSAASTTGGVSTAGTSVSATGTTRVAFLNEQTSHHPPISHFMLEARGPKGTVRCVGADQLGAKFNGSSVSVSVFPGPFNKGLFVTLPERDNEEYQITHPTAIVAGLIRASPYATIGEQAYVTCRGGPSNKKKLRCIISYASESWLLKPKFLVEGVIYEVKGDGTDEQYTKCKQVPTSSIVATLEGCWRGEIRWKRASDKTFKTLVDLIPLAVAPKTVAPLEEQDDLETRKVWNGVTEALHAKQWQEASKAKQALEQAQRVKAEERKKNGETYEPRYFLPQTDEWDGRPQLSQAGKEAIEKEFTR